MEKMKNSLAKIARCFTLYTVLFLVLLLAFVLMSQFFALHCLDFPLMSREGKISFCILALLPIFIILLVKPMRIWALKDYKKGDCRLALIKICKFLLAYAIALYASLIMLPSLLTSANVASVIILCLFPFFIIYCFCRVKKWVLASYTVPEVKAFGITFAKFAVIYVALLCAFEGLLDNLLPPTFGGALFDISISLLCLAVPLLIVFGVGKLRNWIFKTYTGVERKTLLLRAVKFVLLFFVFDLIIYHLATFLATSSGLVASLIFGLRQFLSLLVIFFAKPVRKWIFSK